MECRYHKWSTVVGTPSVIHLYGSKQPISGDDAERLDPYRHNEMVTVNEHEKGYFMYVYTLRYIWDFNGHPVNFDFHVWDFCY